MGREKMEKLGIHEKESEKPEAHLFVKIAGLEHLYSIDEEFVSKVVKDISSRMMEKVDLRKGMEREYLKIMDVMGADYATPTYSGLPLYAEIRYPAVAYGKASLKVRGGSPTEPKVEVEAKGTINYKRMVKAVIVCSVTEKFFESGVETSVHIGSPIKADISLSSGQVHVSIKNPEEPLYNREQTIVEVEVKKPIKSSKEEKKTKIPIGKPLGLDLEVSVKTEEEHFEITRALKDLKASALSLLAGSPVPSYASRRTSVR